MRARKAPVPSARQVFRKIFRKNPLRKPPFHCPLCNSDLPGFNRLDDYYFEKLDEHQSVHSLFQSETLNVLQYSCPQCGASDRSRLYALYLEKRLPEMGAGGSTVRLLDIAPDKNLAAWIRKYPFISYRSVDLAAEKADDRADVTRMELYTDGRFDIVICSHVLEHVTDDRQAISEIYRVLRTGGFAIIMVPIKLNLQEDLENPAWTSEAERWKYYGQNDHVRMYSKTGFVAKLTAGGFTVRQLGAEYFGSEVFKKNGIHPRSVLYLVEK